MLTTAFILETLAAYHPSGDEPLISTVVIDSREAEAGSLFVAFAGDNVDGHDFVADAFRRGAVMALIEREVQVDELTVDARVGTTLGGPMPSPMCVLVENTMSALQTLARAWRQRFRDIRIIGITGSVGKTTTKEMTHAVLARRFRTLKSEGNYNNEIGMPLTLLRLRPWHERVVLEMGMYTSGEISLLCDIAEPQIGVVTLVGAVHMERLGSIEAIARAKRELVEALPADGVAILNHDDERVLAMAFYTNARVVSYGLDPQADLWADRIESRGLEGIYFSLHYEDIELNVHVPLLGRHSVHTALRAAAVGIVEGMTWDEIVAGLQGLTSQLRLVAVSGPNNAIILDDTYNSSPESAMAALNLLADLDGRRVAVLGDMLELGPVEERSHRLVGRRARAVADVLVAVGPLGYFIGEEALAAGMPTEDVHFAADAEMATPMLKSLVTADDVVLIKGSRGARLDRLVTALERD